MCLGGSISKLSLFPRLVFLTSSALLERFWSDLSIWRDRLLRAWSKSSSIWELITFLTCCVIFLLGTLPVAGCWGWKVLLLSLLLCDYQEDSQHEETPGTYSVKLIPSNPLSPRDDDKDAYFGTMQLSSSIIRND